MTQTPNFYIPPVSLGLTLLQLGLYFFREIFHVNRAEDVYVSWKTVMSDGQSWRLLWGQFFHFGKAHMFFTIISLMALGRTLEMKIRAPAFGLITLLMSCLSNLFFIFLTDIICPSSSGSTVGFTTTLVALRVIYIFTMDKDTGDGQRDPNLIFGFLPVYLPNYITPWQPVLETIFFESVITDSCIATSLAGMLAALCFPLLIKDYRNYIMIPRNP